MHTAQYWVVGLPGVPAVGQGDDLPRLILEGVTRTNLKKLTDGDVVVVASKVVSISEGRHVDLSSIKPSKDAEVLAQQIGKNARIVELILRECSSYRLATPRGPIIAKHRLGYELTSAGVDKASVNRAYLLPSDPDASAQDIAKALSQACGLSQLGVVIADSNERADRAGSTVISIGSAGFAPLRKSQPKTSVSLKILEEAIVDMLAAAAGIVIGQRGRGVPFAVIRGVTLPQPAGGLQSILHR